MKTLELRLEGPEFTLIDAAGNPVTGTEPPWRALVKTLVDAPPMANGQPAGFSPDLMRKRLRLSAALDALPADATELELEDADAKELAAALPAVPWARSSQWLLDFCDAIEALAK